MPKDRRMCMCVLHSLVFVECLHPSVAGGCTWRMLQLYAAISYIIKFPNSSLAFGILNLVAFVTSWAVSIDIRINAERFGLNPGKNRRDCHPHRDRQAFLCAVHWCVSCWFCSIVIMPTGHCFWSGVSAPTSTSSTPRTPKSAWQFTNLAKSSWVTECVCVTRNVDLSFSMFLCLCFSGKTVSFFSRVLFRRWCIWLLSRSETCAKLEIETCSASVPAGRSPISLYHAFPFYQGYCKYLWHVSMSMNS